MKQLLKFEKIPGKKHKWKIINRSSGVSVGWIEWVEVGHTAHSYEPKKHEALINAEITAFARKFLNRDTIPQSTNKKRPVHKQQKPVPRKSKKPTRR